MKRRKQTPPAVAPQASAVTVAPIAPPRLPKGRAAASARRARTLAEAAELTRNMLR